MLLINDTSFNTPTFDSRLDYALLTPPAVHLQHREMIRSGPQLKEIVKSAQKYAAIYFDAQEVGDIKSIVEERTNSVSQCLSCDRYYYVHWKNGH